MELKELAEKWKIKDTDFFTKQIKKELENYVFFNFTVESELGQDISKYIETQNEKQLKRNAKKYETFRNKWI